MLQREERIEPQRLRQIAEGQVLGEDRRVGESFLRQHVESDADFHDDPPFNVGGTDAAPKVASFPGTGKTRPRC